MVKTRGRRGKQSVNESEPVAEPETPTGGDNAVPSDLLCLFDETAKDVSNLHNDSVWDDVFSQQPTQASVGTHENFTPNALGTFDLSKFARPVRPMMPQYTLPTVVQTKFTAGPATSRGVRKPAKRTSRAPAAKKRVAKSAREPEPPQTRLLPPSPMAGRPGHGTAYRAPNGRPRSSRFNGVCRHAKSGRYEAHVWLRDCRRQVYLGGHVEEEFAAEAFDIVVLKLARIGDRSRTGSRPLKMNFPESRYANLIDFIDSLTLDELIMEVRRHSEGFARGTSGYRGVSQHANSKYEARIQLPSGDHVYLGTYDSAEKAAAAYDIGIIQMRGKDAATNFPLINYGHELEEYARQHEYAREDPEPQPQVVAPRVPRGRPGRPRKR